MWTSLTRALALDCEMVGVGYEGKRNALARVSLVYSNTQPVQGRLFLVSINYNSLNVGLHFCDCVRNFLNNGILNRTFGVVALGENVGCLQRTGKPVG